MPPPLNVYADVLHPNQPSSESRTERDFFFQPSLSPLSRVRSLVILHNLKRESLYDTDLNLGRRGSIKRLHLLLSRFSVGILDEDPYTKRLNLP